MASTNDAALALLVVRVQRRHFTKTVALAAVGLPLIVYAMFVLRDSRFDLLIGVLALVGLDETLLVNSRLLVTRRPVLRVDAGLSLTPTPRRVGPHAVALSPGHHSYCTSGNFSSLLSSLESTTTQPRAS